MQLQAEATTRSWQGARKGSPSLGGTWYRTPELWLNGSLSSEATTQLVALCLWKPQQTGTSYLFIVRTVGFQPAGSSSAVTPSHLPFLGSDLAVRELESPALGEVGDTRRPIFTAWCEFQPTTGRTFQNGLCVQGRSPQGLAGQTWSSFQCIGQNFH